MGSDHTPIIWVSRVDQILRKGSFKFQKWWLTRPNFREVVAKAWALHRGNKSAMDNWHDNFFFRRIARGWTSNLEADIRKHKKKLMGEYYALDIMSETHPLFDAGRNKLDIILR
jgi:hypothetical protein